MVCQKEDRESRWRCTWCCLSACKDCMNLLTENGRDLVVVKEKLGGMRDSGVVVDVAVS